jgi:hypothetical protein
MKTTRQIQIEKLTNDITKFEILRDHCGFNTPNYLGYDELAKELYETRRQLLRQF